MNHVQETEEKLLLYLLREWLGFIRMFWSSFVDKTLGKFI
jgi:hypothetical protein